MLDNLKNLYIDNERIKCDIYATGEVRELCRVYNPSVQDNLTVFESWYGHGKFAGWQDPETGILYTSHEASPVPALPYELFGVECGKGWYKLIEPLFSYIENYNATTTGDHIIIDQVKEKFGVLCFYVTNSTEELNKMIDEAREKSKVTCEFCGSEEDVGITTTGWYTTCCRKCAKDIANNRKRPGHWTSYTDNKVYTFLPEKYE